MSTATNPQLTITVTRPLKDGGSVTATMTGPASNQKERRLLIAEVAMTASEAKLEVNRLIGPVQPVRALPQINPAYATACMNEDGEAIA